MFCSLGPSFVTKFACSDLILFCLFVLLPLFIYFQHIEILAFEPFSSMSASPLDSRDHWDHQSAEDSEGVHAELCPWSSGLYQWLAAVPVQGPQGKIHFMINPKAQCCICFDRVISCEWIWSSITSYKPCVLIGFELQVSVLPSFSKISDGLFNLHPRPPSIPVSVCSAQPFLGGGPVYGWLD